LLRGRLPKHAGERIDLVDSLLDVAARRKSWNEDEQFLAGALGEFWQGERTDFQMLTAVAEWCARLSATPVSFDRQAALQLAADSNALNRICMELRALADNARKFATEAFARLNLNPIAFAAIDKESIPVSELAERFELMAANIDHYAQWAQLARLRRELSDKNLGDVVARIDGRELSGDAAVTEFRFARAEALWRQAIDESKVLRDMALEERHALVSSFAQLERERLKDNVTSILAAHLAQVPQGTMGEMRVIRGEIGKKRGHIALRRLFERAGSAIQRIKPVLLMSPISVAQFIPPGTLNFDLLVIDEASQVRPEDALGAIARTRQIVVVGDKKQLPPSSFFDRLISEDDEGASSDEALEQDLLGGAAKLGELESVLTLCEARGLSSRMLSWHYRSRDPSLIEVSNREFYENGLILPPSPLQHDPAFGLCLTRVDGVYDRGGKRDNRKEGEAIVSRVAEHARLHPTLSLGIVAFSFAQRNLITELLELARRSDAVLDDFLREGKREDVFVKNIENVQGDERDVILVSVGYGPATPGGRLASMSFGPVNAEGGERRLNVLFTRARVRCEIFVSFDPDDIDLGRTSGEGPRVLKRFLDFAESGRIQEEAPSGREADTPFEEDVADVIRSLGYLADPQVGSAGFLVDLGVRHPDRPGRYILAVECDGATYHSAIWARERDRLRQDVLEQLGWRFHRIWSTDWFYHRAKEIERLRVALAEARSAEEAGVRLTGANDVNAGDLRPVQSAPTTSIIDVPEHVQRTMPPYTRADVSAPRGWLEPHEAGLATVTPLVIEIVNVEGPIHVEEVARRYAQAFGKDKAGSRILNVVAQGLRNAVRTGAIKSADNFYFTTEQEAHPPVRDRSSETGATLKAGSISMIEIRAALQIARDDNAGGSDADLIRTAARLLGFRRVGSDLQARFAQALAE
jgi:hypothetical protein